MKNPTQTEIEILKWKCFDLRIKLDLVLIDAQEREKKLMKYIKFLEDRTKINQ